MLPPLFERFAVTEHGSDTEDWVHQAILGVVKVEYRWHHPNTKFVTHMFVENRSALMEWWHDERTALAEGTAFDLPPGVDLVTPELIQMFTEGGRPLDDEELAQLRELGYIK